MKGTRSITKRYPRLTKYYKVDTRDFIQPYWVHWRRLLRYLKNKKLLIKYKMDENWIREDRILNKKKVFLKLTNDY